MIKSSLTFWQSHRGVRLSQSSNGLSQTWNKHAEKTPDQSQSWSRFGQLNLFANMNEKMWEILSAKLGRFSMSQSNGPFHKVVKMSVGWRGPSVETLVNVTLIFERGGAQGNELVELLLDCRRFPFGVCWSIWYLVPGWQNLAAFRREQKWQWKFSSSAYLQFSRQMRCFCT